MKKELTQKIEEIALALEKYQTGEREVGLYGGEAGIIIFNMYYAKFKNDSQARKQAIIKLEKLIGDVGNKSEIDWVLDAGLAGVTLTVELLNKNMALNLDTDNILGHTDDYFNKVMSYLMWTGNYDFLSGALGIGLYLLKRLSTNNQKEYLIDLIGIMYKVRAKVDKNKIAWKTLISKNINNDVFGYDLGMAHGMAGVVVILVKLYEKSINPIKVKLMLEPLINFILSEKNVVDSFSIFPNKVAENSDNNQTSRLAWCYGDLGISVALWLASQALGRKDWELEAKKTMLHSAKRRNLKQNLVVDAGLCHGTAGIAHIFNRLFIYTGLEELKEASNYWFEQTLKMAKFEDGLGGYKAWHGDVGLENEGGLLDGVAGIGLALISAVSDIDPAWDECLLLS